MPGFTLHAPTTIAEACQTLQRHNGEARAIAGGTALVLMLRQGLVQPSALVRLDQIPGLHGITLEGGQLRIGALTTLREVAESALVRQHLPVLAGTCGLVGNVRVRNAATVGGNLCEADYASDPPSVLTVLDARVRIHGPSGERLVGVSDLITSFYETSLAADEIVTEVVVPLLEPGSNAIYLKYVTRSSEDRPCVGAAALTRVVDGKLADVRVAVGAAAPTPLRLPEAEANARGQQPSPELVATLAQAYAVAADPISDARGSAAYRKQMVALFVRRALNLSLAGQNGARKI